MLARLALPIVGCLCLAVVLPLQAEKAPAWDRAAAGRYLDARMDAWWANAKPLRTGTGETKCLSCHTAVPYVWARQSLRRLDGAARPTGHERRILESVYRRVEHGAGDQPYYDHTDAKRRESRGVEAVLNAVVVTSAEPEDAAAHTRAVEAAIARLWEAQRPDGAWDWLDFGLEPYEAPDAMFHGATMAALAAGTEAGQRASRSEAGRVGLERLRGYLKTQRGGQRAFNQAWLLIAAARLDDVLTPADRDAIVTALERLQQPDGGWSIASLGAWRWTKTEAPFAPPGETDAALLAASDGYATGLVVYALRQAGRAADTTAVKNGQRWLVEHQTPERPGDPAWAPWRAHSLNHDREHGGPRGEAWRRMFMSDLATAFAVLALS